MPDGPRGGVGQMGVRRTGRGYQLCQELLPRWMARGPERSELGRMEVIVYVICCLGVVVHDHLLLFGIEELCGVERAPRQVISVSGRRRK